MLSNEDIRARYKMLTSYTSQLIKPERPIVGRDKEVQSVLASLARPELSNVILLADAGTGKTALVQQTMLEDSKRLYLEVDLARMISDLENTERMAARIKQLFDEAERFSADEEVELVLFIDEFHQVVQLSAAAVEALKPVLAASGSRGIRVIAATTYDEFNQHIRQNQPLVERLQRINLNPPDEKVTIEILKGMAHRYGVLPYITDPNRLFSLIYEYTERYMTSQAQPRKSILVLDSMVGWYRSTNQSMDMKLLTKVIEESTGINVAFDIDAVKIREELNKRVFAQQMATRVVADRLQLAVADLYDHNRPISSFLFTGATGTGKTELTKQIGNLLFGDHRGHLIRFDGSEYANADSLDLFRKQLTERVWSMGHAILMIDEVEKMSGENVRLLLQVLDDGRLTDDNGRQVSFLNTYIVMTTNAGSEIFNTIAQYSASDDGDGSQLKSRMKEISRSIISTTGDNRFPPELMGRIDVLVPFQPLSRATQQRIVESRILQLAKEVAAKHGVQLRVSGKVVQYLIEDEGDTDAAAGGARGVIKKLVDEVTTKVATYINSHPNVKKVAVAIEGTLASDDKTLRTSDARVVVGPSA